VLQSDYKDDISLEEVTTTARKGQPAAASGGGSLASAPTPLTRSLQAVKLVVKVLSKSMDSTALTSEKVELTTLSLVDGQVAYRMYEEAALRPLLDAVNAERSKEQEQAA
jgi:hypothetical protein